MKLLKNIEGVLLNQMTLKGYPEIAKVYMKKINTFEYDSKNGGYQTVKDNWMIETDGTALQKILTVAQVDHKRTSSNAVVEIIQILGIEAVRLSLINELRNVLGFYGIYVNYRHLATLCDIMTQRGHLTAITRHGINRVESGPLRMCSFEETVEILFEAATFAETDHLKGITENIIMGQLAPLGTGYFKLLVDKDKLKEA
jgi:DNA-directed RNA polymerase II subunit RPB1